MKGLFMNLCKWMLWGMKLLWFLGFIGAFKSNGVILKCQLYVRNGIFCNSSNLQLKILDAKLEIYKKVHDF